MLFMLLVLMFLPQRLQFLFSSMKTICDRLGMALQMTKNIFLFFPQILFAKCPEIYLNQLHSRESSLLASPLVFLW